MQRSAKIVIQLEIVLCFRGSRELLVEGSDGIDDWRWNADRTMKGKLPTPGVQVLFKTGRAVVSYQLSVISCQ
jgi:hypothetical protein